MKVLIALDLKDHPENVVGKASEWVERFDAQADLAYVMEGHDMNPYITNPAIQDMVSREWQRIREDEYSRLKQLLEILPQGNRGIARLGEGKSVDALATMAEGYDAVLIGTHGRQWLNRLWMGSVAEGVVRRAPCPVLVLRLGE